MSLEIRTRKDLDTIPDYVAGKPPALTPGVKSYKMSSNENPHEPLPQVLRALAEKTDYNLYPEPFAESLRAQLAKIHGIDTRQVLTTAGGVALIYQVFDALLHDAHDEVIYPWRSFEAYPIAADMAGGTSVQIPLTESGDHNLNAMADAVTDHTKLIVLCSPNNPTGNAISAEDFEAFMNRIPSDIGVFLDEAYYEFVTDETAVRGEKYLERYPNLMLLRTFSKAYGLAGLRVGYLLTSVDFAKFLSKLSRPFEVSGAALLAATTSLTHREEALERIQSVVSERTRLRTGLEKLGYADIMPPSEGNFIWLPVKEKTASMVEYLQKNGITVRPYGKNEGFRVTVSSPEANDAFMKAMAQLK